ncbi:tripartite tricarboxylate transporter substrate-binding protein [Ramlibacter sp. 2FC]|uniref:Bug family tripartite tricarboxylate transporter substrate binding protein n=1 Tax=Ramlibacter sp. 2FC TaxID=2502188 RepID=UPI0010F71C62|nr:tripartite tricarboxylate transporter substrate-binding protein [Ramlibacter sp. 2FC]
MERRHFLAVTAGGAVALSGAALAQTYPRRPVRMIVPFAAGGSTDVIARALSEGLGRDLGQPVVIDNRAGAGGAVGTMEMLRSVPDGHTVAMVSSSNTAAVPAMNPKIGYNPVADFTPIMNIAAVPWLIAVHPSFPARNYKDFLAELKRRPGHYSYASSGVGGILHLQMEVFKSLTGIFVTHIPYRGAGPAVADVMAGQVQIAVDSPTSIPAIRDGRLIPIVVAAPQRMKEHPDMPTFAEVGLPQLNRMSHFGVVGPKGTPRDAVDRLNLALRRVLQDAGVRARLEGSGATIVAGSPAEFSREIKELYEQLQRVVAERKLTTE